MKKNVKIALIIILSLLILLNIKFYINEDKNERIWGVKFGDKISTLDVIKKYEAKNGDMFYEVNIDKKFKKEGYTYIVNTVPGTKEVFSISAKKKILSKDFKNQCLKEKEELEKKLPNNLVFGRNDIEGIDVYLNEDLFIYISCTDIENYLVISYNNIKK